MGYIGLFKKMNGASFSWFPPGDCILETGKFLIKKVLRKRSST
jgi:hypothetical protein